MDKIPPAGFTCPVIHREDPTKFLPMWSCLPTAKLAELCKKNSEAVGDVETWKGHSVLQMIDSFRLETTALNEENIIMKQDISLLKEKNESMVQEISFLKEQHASKDQDLADKFKAFEETNEITWRDAYDRLQQKTEADMQKALKTVAEKYEAQMDTMKENQVLIDKGYRERIAKVLDGGEYVIKHVLPEGAKSFFDILEVTESNVDKTGENRDNEYRIIDTFYLEDIITVLEEVYGEQPLGVLLKEFGPRK